MIFRAGNVTKYGIPYQGSKQKIIGKLAKLFPQAENFYDLFGGGFSVTHYMLEHYSKKYKYFYFNEVRSGICELIQDAIAGKYNYEVFKPEWISREKFMAEKESNAYIKIVWSFGNNGEGYIFGTDIEQEKRSMHQAIIFNEFDDWFKDTFKIDRWPISLNFTDRRLYLKHLLRDIQRIDLEQLERLQRLQRLQRLEQLQQLEFTNLDYRQVKIKPNSIIYCDIPYKSTADYGSEFSHDEFFNWADEQSNPVFISEYNIEDQRFRLVREFKHRSTFSAEKNNSQVVEKLYGNKAAYGAMGHLFIG